MVGPASMVGHNFYDIGEALGILNDLEQYMSDSLRCCIFRRERKEGKVGNGAGFVWVTESKYDRFVFYLGSQGKKINEKANAWLLSVWGNIIDFSRNQSLWQSST